MNGFCNFLDHSRSRATRMSENKAVAKNKAVPKDHFMGKARPLFATPVLVDQIEDPDELNTALEQTILAKQSEHPGMKLSNRGGWQSTHDFARWSGPSGRTIVERAVELASAHTIGRGDSAPRWSVEAWANVSGPGSFNMPHIHGGTFWAAVYYVRVGDGEG